MTRAQEIERLRTRYATAVAKRKRKEASVVYAQMKSLVTRQVKHELRQERRAS